MILCGQQDPRGMQPHPLHCCCSAPTPLTMPQPSQHRTHLQVSTARIQSAGRVRFRFYTLTPSTAVTPARALTHGGFSPTTAAAAGRGSRLCW